jgi:hypothetical protein
MEFLKRNTGLAILGAISMVLAIVLAVSLHHYSGEAADYRAQVEKLEEFFQKLRQARIAVTNENLEAVEKNLDLTEEKLARARELLWRRTRIPVQQASGVECKNILREETLRLRRLLDEQGIEVTQQAADFSFSNILQASALPAADEVPVILKQLAVISEIVRVAAAANVSQIIAVERSLDLGSHQSELYEVMPVQLKVSGHSINIQRFMNALQQDDDFVFYVPFFTMTAEDVASNTASLTQGPPTTAAARGGVFIATGVPPIPGRAPRMDPTELGPQPEVSGPQELEVVELSDVVQAEMRVDFIQFRNPNPTE